jgi:hypothetical protein
MRQVRGVSVIGQRPVLGNVRRSYERPDEVHRGRLVGHIDGRPVDQLQPGPYELDLQYLSLQHADLAWCSE